MVDQVPSPSPSPPAIPAPTVSPALVLSAPDPLSPDSQTPPASPPASKRPAYVPESFWDATNGKVKDTEFAAHYNELQTRVAADDSRRLTIPAKPEDYVVALPKDFALPDGVKFDLDASNTLWSQGQQWATKHGLSQDAFAEAIALVAGDRVGTQAQITQARNAEIAKLGVNGTARVTAIETWATGVLGSESAGKQFTSRLFTASDVQMAEALISRFTGSGNFRSGGREPPEAAGKITEAQYQAMSLPQRLAYAREQSAKRAS